MSNHEHFLRLFLRIICTTWLTAAFFVFVPQTWLEAIHQRLGWGNLPGAPVVSYLARCTSVFYALFGGLLWVVSFDLRRHRVVLRYLGVALILAGWTATLADLLGRADRLRIRDFHLVALFTN